MAANEILEFGQGVTTYIMSQSDYVVNAPAGLKLGEADIFLQNKFQKQVSMVAAGVASYVAANQAIDVTDALGGSSFNVMLETAIQSPFKSTAPNEGATLVSLAEGATVQDRIKSDITGLQFTPTGSGMQVSVAGYFPGVFATATPALGYGGSWVWDAACPKASHDGGTKISPTVPWDGTYATHSAFLAGTGETDPTGNGCWVRLLDAPDTVSVGMFGADYTGTNAADYGNISITTGFTIPKASTLVGESKESSVITYSGSGACITLADAVGYYDKQVLKTFTLKGPLKAAGSKGIITATETVGGGSSGTLLNGLYVRDFDYGISGMFIYGDFKSMMVASCNTGIRNSSNGNYLRMVKVQAFTCVTSFDLQGNHVKCILCSSEGGTSVSSSSVAFSCSGIVNLSYCYVESSYNAYHATGGTLRLYKSFAGGNTNGLLCEGSVFLTAKENTFESNSLQDINIAVGSTNNKYLKNNTQQKPTSWGDTTTGYEENVIFKSGLNYLVNHIQRGALEIDSAGAAVYMHSPNGTRYAVTVSDAGAIVVTAVP